MSVRTKSKSSRRKQPCLHLEQADTGRDTLSRGLSARLDRCMVRTTPAVPRMISFEPCSQLFRGTGRRSGLLEISRSISTNQLLCDSVALSIRE